MLCIIPHVDVKPKYIIVSAIQWLFIWRIQSHVSWTAKLKLLMVMPHPMSSFASYIIKQILRVSKQAMSMLCPRVGFAPLTGHIRSLLPSPPLWSFSAYCSWWCLENNRTSGLCWTLRVVDFIPAKESGSVGELHPLGCRSRWDDRKLGGKSGSSRKIRCYSDL